MNVPFEAFFEAVWGHTPYPWQVELSKQVREDGWPPVLDLPTGSGKTAALDVALHHFVIDRGVAAPRRILMVVDRRVIVDQVGIHANRILEALRSAKADGTEHDKVLHRFRVALESIVGPHAPLLHTEVLRGGAVRSDAWAKYPHTPVLAGSTVDQVGSRLFFRGYGVSERMQSVHAGLLGCDTLLLLDEVHLARPFADVLEQLAGLRRARQGFDLGRRFAFVQLSATPGALIQQSADDSAGATDGAAAPREPVRALRLTEADRRNKRLARILGAAKPATLKLVPARGRDDRVKRQALAIAAVRYALEMVAEGRKTVAIVVNRVDTARRAWALLAEKENGFDPVLVTGRMRPLDQADALRRVDDRIVAGRPTGAYARPLVLVATQCIEAGADYDFDGLVTEVASLDALRQRFGRLDRRGEYALRAAPWKVSPHNAAVPSAEQTDESEPPTAIAMSRRTARAVILARSDQIGKGEHDPIYGGALRSTWRWLERVAVNGIVNLGIDELQPHLDALGSGIEGLLAPTRPAPVLLSAYLDQWVQTNPTPHADPDVSLFLHGIPKDARSAVPDVQVVWRSDVTEMDLDVIDRRQKRELFERLAMVPPGSLESLSLPVHAVKQWLAGASHPADDDIADVEGAAPGVMDGEAEARRVLVWHGTSRSDVVNANSILAGDVVVVPESYGGLGVHGTFEPAARPPDQDAPLDEAPLYDLGDAVQLLQRGRPTLRLDSRVIGRIANTSFEPKLPDPDDDEVDRRVALTEALAELKGSTGHAPAWFQQGVAALERPRFERLPGGGWIALATRMDRPAGVSLDPLGGGEEEDESFVGRPRPEVLDTHLRDVSDLATEFAARAQLPLPIVTAIKWSGRLHDIGKLDPRFQVWLHGGDEISARFGDKLAKSPLSWQSRAARRAARQRAGYPDGQRHELVSLALLEGSQALRERIEADGADWDLVLHLVASHHGWCRPLPPVAHVSFGLSDIVSSECDGIELTGSTAHGFSRLGSGVSERFWKLVRAYGWHELAYLEAILRLADHRQSAGEAKATAVPEPVAGG